VRAALAAANVARGSREGFTEKRLPLAAARATRFPKKRRRVAGNALATPLRMRIAQVAPLYERVPPMLYGGTERVVSHLVEEQVRRGHEVTLFASGDSRTGAALVSPIPRALRLDLGTSDMLAPHVVELSQVFERASEFDLIHCHVDYLAFPFSRLVATLTVHTLHGRLDGPHTRRVLSHFEDVPLVSISDAQREPLQGMNLTWAGTVHHGLPVDEYREGTGRGGYLAFLGRISPEKRPDLAIAAAKQAGMPLKIAAKVDPTDRTYFEREIEPLLDHPLVEYLGEIGEADRADFLGAAAALVFPIDWPEPFGLVMIGRGARSPRQRRDRRAALTKAITTLSGATSALVRLGSAGRLFSLEVDGDRRSHEGILGDAVQRVAGPHQRRRTRRAKQCATEHSAKRPASAPGVRAAPVVFGKLGNCDP
jgi:glycosyltransferase involved in cell wall biosynthesis